MDPRDLIGDLPPELQASWTNQYAKKPEELAAGYPLPDGGYGRNMPPADAVPPAYVPRPIPTGLAEQRAAHELPGAPGSPDRAKAQDRMDTQLRGIHDENIAGATFYDPGNQSKEPANISIPRPPQPSGVVPGGWQNDHRTKVTKQGYEVGEPVKQGYANAETSAEHAAALGRDAGIAKAEAESAYFDRHAQKVEEHRIDTLKRADDHAQQFDREYGTLQKFRDEVASGTLDPDQHWATRDGGQKFAIGLSVILGAISQSLTGGENPGLKMLNDAIGRNIDAQKTKLANSHGKLDAQRSLMGDLRAHFGDTDRADQAAWMLYLDKAKGELASEMAKASIPEVKAKYAGAIELIDKESAGRLERWSKDANDSITIEQNDKYRPAQHVGGVDEKAIVAEANKRFNDPNFQAPPGVSREDAAYRSAKLSFTGRDVASGLGASNVSTPDKTVSDRTVLWDGKPRIAISKNAAEAAQDYTEAAPDVKQAHAALVQAWKDGDVGKYNAARGQLLDSMPKFMLGSKASGPTRAQARDTYGELIPEYGHWYKKPGFQHRNDEALDVLGNMIAERGKTVEHSAFQDSGKRIEVRKVGE